MSRDVIDSDLITTRRKRSSSNLTAAQTVKDVSTTAGTKKHKKSNRFTWSEDLHRLFVAAVFDVGLRNSSPKALLKVMGKPATSAGVSTEHLKSHLQKFRLNYYRSKEEFLSIYEHAFEFDRSNGDNNKKKCLASPQMVQHNGDSNFKSSAELEAIACNVQEQASMPEKNLMIESKQQQELQDQLFEQRLIQQQLQARLTCIPDTGNMYCDTSATRVCSNGSSTPPSSLQGSSNLLETSHLDCSQLEMRVAMQAQMSLHRQMLLRKVEVTQRGAGSSCDEEAEGNVIPCVTASISSDREVCTSSCGSTSSLSSSRVPSSSSVETASSSRLPELPLPPADDLLEVYEWDPLSLDIGLDEEDLFRFLSSTT